MATREHAEIISITEDVQRPFQLAAGGGFKGGLWQRNDAFEAILHATWDIQATLPRDLTIPQPQYSYDLKDDALALKGELNNAFEIYIEPHSSLARVETKADWLEEWSGNAVNRLGLGTGGAQIDDILYGLCTKYYVPVWLRRGVWRLPARHPDESNKDWLARVAAYEAAWWEWSLRVEPVKSTAYVESEGRRLTLAVRDVQIPYIDLGRYYGDYDRAEERTTEQERRLFLEICKEQFPGIRAAQPQARDGAQATGLGDVANVKEIDDGVTITHHAEGLKRDRKGNYEWREIGSYPNLIGRPSCFILSGVYNGGEALENSREPLLLSQALDISNRDWAVSFLMSYVASARNDIVSGDSTSNADFMRMEHQDRIEFNADLMPPQAGQRIYMPGRLGSSLATPEQIKLIQDNLVMLETRINARRWWNLLGGGLDTKELVERSTLGAVQLTAEKSQKSLQGTREGLSHFIDELLGAIQTGYMNMANPHYKKGSGVRDEDKDVGLSWMNTGEERVRGRKVERGEKRTLLPADLDFSFTRHISQPDVSMSALEIRRRAVLALWDRNPRLVSYDKTLTEIGETNLTEVKKDIWADGIFQTVAPVELQKAVDGASELADKLLGRMTGQPAQPAPVEVVPAAPGVAQGQNGASPRPTPFVDQGQGAVESMGPLG